MPGRKHLRGASRKEQRMYEHIKESSKRSGRYGKRAKEVAARTVDHVHAEKAAIQQQKPRSQVKVSAEIARARGLPGLNGSKASGVAISDRCTTFRRAAARMASRRYFPVSNSAGAWHCLPR